MRINFRTVLVALTLFCAAFPLDARAEAPGPFAGGVTDAGQLADGTTVVVTNTAIYVADKPPSEWIKLSPPGMGRISALAGGSRDSVFIVTRDDGDTATLQVVIPGRATRTIRNGVGRACAFLSCTVGCCSQQRALDITSDGGTTWHKNKSPLLDAGEELVGVNWVTDQRLVVSGSMGGIALCNVDIKANTLQTIWAKKLDAPAYCCSNLDRTAVWAWGSDCFEFRMSDGRELVHIVPNMEVEGISVDASRLYASGFDGYYVWSVDGDTATPAGRLHPDITVAKVFVVAGISYAVSTEGNLFTVKGLESEKIKVSIDDKSPPSTQPAAYPGLSSDQMRELGVWLQRVAPDTRQRIFAEANARTDWTPKQRFDWTIEQFRREAAGKQ